MLWQVREITPGLLRRCKHILEAEIFMSDILQQCPKPSTLLLPLLAPFTEELTPWTGEPTLSIGGTQEQHTTLHIVPWSGLGQRARSSESL